MIVRNGVRSTLRARGRTILFTLLILLLTVALALGLGMWAYCAQTLAAMDESYASVALVEYMGENYPETDAADEYARQAAQTLDGAAVAAIDGVELWEESDQALAALSGYQRDLGAIPYEDYAVVVATNLSAMTPTQSVVTEADLSCRAIQEGELVSLYGPDGELQAQVPYYEYGVDWSIGRAGYYSLEIDEDGVRRYTLVAEEDLPEVRYVLDFTSRSTPPYQGQYYGPDLGWDTQGYMGYAAGNGQYLVYDVVYSGSITQTLYSQDGRDNILAIFEAGDTGFVPERGRRYLRHLCCHRLLRGVRYAALPGAVRGGRSRPDGQHLRELRRLLPAGQQLCPAGGQRRHRRPGVLPAGGPVFRSGPLPPGGGGGCVRRRRAHRRPAGPGAGGHGGADRAVLRRRRPL